MNSESAHDERTRHRAALELLRLPPFSKAKNRGPFVAALEGPNGAGKTTLGRALAKTLGVHYCLGTDAAWFSESFRARMIRDAPWHASAMFFLSGCFEQMRSLADRHDRLVIMDRSLWSTLAVHGARSAERLDALLAMLRPIAREIQVPNLTVTLQASFGTCQSRIAKKSGLDQALDQLTGTAAFHAREEQFYRWLGRQRDDIVFLDADQDGPEQVAERALHLIRQAAPC